MKHRQIGSTSVSVSELSLGGASLGNLYEAITDASAHDTVDAAWDVGVRYFDTAPHYGLGLSERRLGEALGSRPRDAFVLSTKVGRLIVPNPDPHGSDVGFAVPDTTMRQWDFSGDGIRRSLTESLERLGLERIDVVFIHDPDDHWDEAVGSAYPALEAMRSEGTVSAIGVGMNQSRMLTDFVRQTDIDVIMLAGRYTLLDQRALDDVLPACLERGVSVINVGVFNSGILASPDPQPGSQYDYAVASDDVLQRARDIAACCERHGTTLPAAAVQFGRTHPAIVSTAVGTGRPDRMRSNAAFFDAPVPDDLWRELSDIGLIRGDARPDIVGS